MNNNKTVFLRDSRAEIRLFIYNTALVQIREEENNNHFVYFGFTPKLLRKDI